jgi:outer membrane receptor protein involved in Fe transport
VRRPRCYAAGAAFTLLLTTPASAQQPGQYLFSLPEEALSRALQDVATKTGRNFIAPDELVQSRNAPALAGSFTAEQAVGRLLEGSGLRYRLVDGAFVIERIPLVGPADSMGRDDSDSQGIVVTGTHLRGAPPTSPVITLSRREVEESGATSVEGLMRHLPQNVSAGVDQENFGVAGSGSDITQNGAGINLRGLGQRATLVLINGRRVAPSDTGAFVDVSLIPISAIDRVEVLTDGASAIYGSDAVGGVVNFILRNDFAGVEPVVQFGTTTDGGGRQLLAGLTAGHRWSGGRALVSYEYRDDGPVRARDRDFTINLEPDWFLLPREKRHSVYGSARQDLAANLALEVSGLFAVRRTKRTFFDATQIAIGADSRARSIGGTAALQLRPGGSWLAEASATYDRTRTREISTQGGALFNRSNTLNGFGEIAVKADGNLLDLPGGALKLALGGGVRREHFRSVFETKVNIASPVEASRTVSSAYGELSVPIFSAVNRRSGLEQLTLTAAGRFEHYEHIGSTFNPKLGILWAPVPGLAVRGSYGTSFRAPLLSESAGVYNVFLFPVAILYRDPGMAPTGVGAAVIGSNPEVRPERSKSLAVGVDITPPRLPGLRFSTNYYKIDFTNRIALPSPEVDLIGDPGFAPIVDLSPLESSVADLFAGANQVLDFSGPGFTNGGATPADVVAVVDDRVSNTAETRTSGLDVLLSYSFHLKRDDFRAELNANRVFRFDDKLTTVSPWIQRLDTPFNPVRWRARAGLSWRHGPVSTVAFLNYTGSYRDNRTLVTRPVRSFTTVDAGLALDGSAMQASWLKRLRLAFNVQNLFDASPPRLVPSPGSDAGIGYDPVNASGRGRLLSVQLRGSW